MMSSILKIITKRHLYIFIKILLVIIIFGLYFVILLRESMQAMKESKAKINKNEMQRTRKVQKFRNYIKSSSSMALKLDINSNVTIHLSVGKSSSTSDHHQLQLEDDILSLSQQSTLNPIYEYSEEVNAATEKEFTKRKNMLWEVCLKKKIVGVYPPNAWEFFISPGHGLAWCNVFKAASSTWMYYFNILGGYNLAFLQRTKSSPLELARKRFPRPNLPELTDALTNSISFLTVREPFERLLSAYRNKLEGYRNKYYKLLGKQIVKNFRYSYKKFNSSLTSPTTLSVNKNQYHRRSKSAGPTFKEFLLFLIHHYKTGGRFDEHWSPIYTFCTPCSINFTLIAKVETFQRDTEYIIRQAGLETLLLNKLPNKKVRTISNQSTSDTKSLIPRYFSQIDEDTLRKVLEIYETDFELFGYNATKYYEYVIPTTFSSESPLPQFFQQKSIAQKY